MYGLIQVWELNNRGDLKVKQGLAQLWAVPAFFERIIYV